ncbi:MAG: hypothetical protein ACM359_07995 [Bacillota bacterium]
MNAASVPQMPFRWKPMYAARNACPIGEPMTAIRRPATVAANAQHMGT